MALRTAFHLFLSNRGALGDYSAAEYSRLARYTEGWAANQTEVLTQSLPTGVPQDWTALTDYTDAIKALGTGIRIGIYAGSAVFARPYEPRYEQIADADLMVGSDGTTLVYVTNDVRHRWPKLMVGEVRERLASYLVAFCDDNDLDGVLFDSWSPDYYALQVASGWFSYAGGTREGPYHTAAAWLETLGTWTLEAQAALEAAGHKLYINGLGIDPLTPPTGLGALQVNTANYATGVLHEGVHQAYKDATVAGYVISAVRTAAERGAEVHFWAQPNMFRATHPDGSPDFSGSTVAYTLGDALQRFYLNTYLQAMHPTLTYYGYSDGYRYQTYTPDGTASNVYYSDDWDHEYGTPTGHHVDGGTTRLWWRRFTRGVSVLNPTASELTFREPGAYRLNHPTAGQVVSIGPEAATWHRMDPYTGAFLFNRLEAA